MPVLVTDAGFAPDDWLAPFLPLADLAAADPAATGHAVDFPNDRDPAELAPWFDRLALVRVAFPAMGDGRGLSIARQLRELGYTGRLRAAGPLIADQVRAARRVGFDEVELPDSVAARQPADLWLARPAPSYRERLIGRE